MAQFRAPFRSTGFFDPTKDNLDNCELDFQTAEYTRESIQLLPGCMVTLAAFVLPDTDSFIIDFMAAQSQVALHLRAKVSDGVLAMNSTVAGKWQAEMKVRELPLRKGRAFGMSVLVTSKAYMISYNDEHFAAFPHRLPVESVTSMAIYRGLKIGAIYYEVDYKYSPLSFTISDQAEHRRGVCSNKSASSTAIYPQLPYRMSLGEGDKQAGGFFSKGGCLLMTLKPDCTAKTLKISFLRAGELPAMDLELFVNHSQGRINLHAESKTAKEHSLWSIIGLNRKRHADVCVCCTDSELRLFVCHRPVFRATRDELKALWGCVTDLQVTGESDLIVAHFCRL